MTPSSSTSMLAAVLPVRQLGDLGAQPALGVVHQLGGGLLDQRRVVALGQLANAALRRFQRADHGVEIAPGVVRRAVVGEDDPPDVLDVLAAVDQLDRREAQPFLVDVGRVGGEGARGLAADLGDVPDVAGEPEEVVADETSAASSCARGGGNRPGSSRCGRGRRRGGSARSPSPPPPISPCAGSRPSSTACSSSRRSGRRGGRAAPS